MISTYEPFVAPVAVIGFAYGRVSSSGGGAATGTSRQEQSLEVQDSLFREYINEIRLPLDSIQFYMERGSGWSKQDVRRRREGAKMWAEIVRCRQLQPDAEIHLLLTKVDRIGRGWLATQLMFSELRQLRVRIHIIGLGGKAFDCDSLMGQKMLADLAFFSQWEVENTRRNIKQTIDFKFSRRQLCGETPFGFTTRETGEVTGKGVRIRELVDEPEQQKWILHMADLRRQNWTFYAIAKDLNQRGVPTKKAGTRQRVTIGSVEGVPITEERKVRNEWTAGKVEKILNAKTIQAWLAAQSSTTDSHRFTQIFPNNINQKHI